MTQLCDRIECSYENSTKSILLTRKSLLGNLLMKKYFMEVYI